MAAEKSSSLSLGQLLAFGVPGFVAFKAAALHSATASAWLMLALDKDQGIGVFLFVALGSLALGVIVSGIRALIIDQVLCSKLVLRRWALTRPTVNYAQLAGAERLAAYESINENYFRYYLFYANTSIAAVLLALSRVVGSHAAPVRRPDLLLIGMVLVVLLWSARDSFSRFTRAATQLSTVQSGGNMSNGVFAAAPEPTPAPQAPSESSWQKAIGALEDLIAGANKANLPSVGGQIAGVLQTIVSLVDPAHPREAERLADLQEAFAKGDQQSLQTWIADTPAHPNYSVALAKYYLASLQQSATNANRGAGAANAAPAGAGVAGQ
jgi:hypothetical protein